MPIISSRYEYHSGRVRLSLSDTASFVQRQLLENTLQILATGWNLFDKGTIPHLLFEKVGRQKLAANGVQYVLHFRVATVLVVFHPFQDGIVDLTLLLNVELVFADQLD